MAAALGLRPDDVLDLSASLNPGAPDVAALAAPHLGALGRYPDVDAAEATLAAGLDLPADRLVLTAGGAQAIALVAAHLGAGRVDEPEFSLYRRHLPRLDPDAPRWRSDPHNPSGLLAGPDDTAGVWDEAFLPLAAGVWTRGRSGWSLGSLTKAFACPGLRLGYALAPDAAAADALRGARPAWAVGSLSCAVLPDLLAAADTPAWTAAVAKGRAELVAVLRAHGWDPVAADAPWVLVPRAAGLRDALGPSRGGRAQLRLVRPGRPRPHRGARRRRARPPRRGPRHRCSPGRPGPWDVSGTTRRRALGHHGGRRRDLPARPRWTR